MRQGLWTQTTREKAGSIDGLGLFFGALLGANLGSLEALSASDYFKIVVLLAGAVVAIQMAVRSERRLYAISTLALYAVLIGIVTWGGTMGGETLAEGARHKLGITLGCWVGLVLLIELFPTRDAPAAIPADQATATGSARAATADGSNASR